MFAWKNRAIGRLLPRFVRRSGGSVVPLFAFLAVPAMALIGAATDYSRASNVRVRLQTSLDSALLAGVKDGSTNWSDVATAVFNADVARLGVAGVTGTGQNGQLQPSFNLSNGTYTASVSGTVPTTFMTVLAMSSINVAAASAAVAQVPEKSCILSYDAGRPLSDTGVNFGGAPSISMSGCAIRSNTSLNCNGHNGGATESIAAGTASGCSNPESYARVVQDIYAPLASNISLQCGLSNSGLTWDASVTGVPAGVRVVAKTNYTEYHVCGNLTLKNTGTLLSNAPTADSAIVVENGSLTLANNAVVSTLRTVIIMTGPTSSAPSPIDFPNGNGQSASLLLSPPLTAGNPWQGVALYQDPRQTGLVSDDWGPGATFKADGVVYLPSVDLTMRGIAASNNYQCSKIATHTFSTNGNVNLNFAQSGGGCSTIGMKQAVDIPLHLTQ
jgi:Flp pilus assembly protein TadG